MFIILYYNNCINHRPTALVTAPGQRFATRELRNHHVPGRFLGPYIKTIYFNASLPCIAKRVDPPRQCPMLCDTFQLTPCRALLLGPFLACHFARSTFTLYHQKRYTWIPPRRPLKGPPQTLHFSRLLHTAAVLPPLPEWYCSIVCACIPHFWHAPNTMNTTGNSTKSTNAIIAGR